MDRFSIDPEISRAHTLHADAYRDPAVLAMQRESVFARSWQFVHGAAGITDPGHVRPCSLLGGFLDEPVLFTRDAERLRCLSNVCTHRGSLVALGEGRANTLRCRYH